MPPASSIVDRSVLLSSLSYLKGQAAARLGLSRHRSGATHSKFSLDKSTQYIREVVADYFDFARVPDGWLAGRRVLEIGPGDNLGVALTFLAKGAASVTCLDRFESDRDDARNARIYRNLLDDFTADERARAAGALSWSPDGTARFDPARIDYRHGVPIEEAPRSFGDGRFDVILSRAVLEHVYDLDAAWRAMAGLLTPDGELWHKVDFGNHGFFDGVHPLWFLTPDRRLWDLVSSPDPTLNRQRRPAYRRLAAETFPHVRVYATNVVGGRELERFCEEPRFGIDYFEDDVRMLEAIRPRLPEPFRGMGDTDLLVSGMFIVCSRGRAV
jgi:SAM-dependent methyltransferase